MHVVNLSLLDKFFVDGDTINVQTLREKNLIPRRVQGGIKILSQGELTKKVTIEAHAFSESAREKLEKAGIPFNVIAIKEPKE